MAEHPREAKPAELTRCERMLDQIPATLKRDWSSAQGQTLLAEMVRLRNEGVPLAWLSEQLGLSIGAVRPLVRHYFNNSHSKGQEAARNDAS